MGRPKKDKPTRSDGRYEVKVIIGRNFDGTPMRKSFMSTISKADAKKKSEEYLLNQKVSDITGVIPIDNDILFSKWASEWLETKKGTVKDSTYSFSFVSSVNNHLIPFFGAAQLNTIKQIHIQKFFNEKQKELSKETLKKIKMCLNGIFESAIDNELCNRNPCKNIKLKEDAEKTKKNVYTKEQTELILKYAENHRYGLEIILLLEYGLRRGELLGLKWQDIDFENQTLNICRAVADVKNADTNKMEVIVEKPKTAYSQRTIPIASHIMQQLKDKPRYVVIGANQRKKTDGVNIPTDYIFHNKLGEVCSPRTWSRRHYEVFMKEMHEFYLSQTPSINIPELNPHELRHTRATLWVNDDLNLFAVASVLGHGDLKMLRSRYAHADVDSIRNSLKIQ